MEWFLGRNGIEYGCHPSREGGRGGEVDTGNERCVRLGVMSQTLVKL